MAYFEARGLWYNDVVGTQKLGMESWFGSNSMMEFEAKIPKKFCLPYCGLGQPNLLPNHQEGHFISILALKWPTSKLSGRGKTMDRRDPKIGMESRFWVKLNYGV